jgi:hypothetical protein
MLTPRKSNVNKQFPQINPRFRGISASIYVRLSIFAEVSRSGILERLDHLFIE